MKRTKLVKLIVLVVCLGLVTMLFRNCSVSKNVQDENELTKISDSIVTEEQIAKKQIEQELEKYETVINNDVEIILLEIADKYVISHERTEDSFFNWLFSSSISLDISYTATISIPTNEIDIVRDTNELKVYYDLDKLVVKSVEINSIKTRDKYGVLAKEYSPSEVSALALLATEQIRENVINDEMLLFMAEQNLRNYLRNLAFKMYVFNIKIEENITE